MRETEPLLTVQNIGRRIPGGESWLLEDVSLEIYPGDRLAIAGPSGAGKTLLLRALALLDPVDAGRILRQGQPISREAIPAYRRQVIYLHQRPILFDGDVENNLRMPFTLRVHRDLSFDPERIADLLSRLGRDRGFLAKSPGDLSGGEAQIVALLRAIQLDPAILLLDEPTAALDETTALAIEQLILHWQHEASDRRSLVWVSHNRAQTERLANRVLFLAGGRLERNGDAT